MPHTSPLATTSTPTATPSTTTDTAHTTTTDHPGLSEATRAPVQIATHSGTFHADDVFGVGVLMGVFPAHTLLRTRDAALLEGADFVVDVGGVWDAAHGRFDHHQRGFDGARPAQQPEPPANSGATPASEPVGYASAGLVWTAWGAAYVQAWAQTQAAVIGPQGLDPAAVAEVVRSIDESLVQYLDMVDTGQADVAPGIFGLSSLIAQLNTHWLEEQGLDHAAKAALQDQRFVEAVGITRRFLDRAISKKVAQIRALDTVRQSPRLLGGRLLQLREGGMPWTHVVVHEMPEVLLVVYPDSEGQQFQLKTVPVQPGSFTARMDLPAAWAGLRDAELAAASGVADSVFCHMNLFIAGARSLEGAVALAQQALAGAPR